MKTSRRPLLAPLRSITVGQNRERDRYIRDLQRAPVYVKAITIPTRKAKPMATPPAAVEGFLANFRDVPLSSDQGVCSLVRYKNGALTIVATEATLPWNAAFFSPMEIAKLGANYWGVMLPDPAQVKSADGITWATSLSTSNIPALNSSYITVDASGRLWSTTTEYSFGASTLTVWRSDDGLGDDWVAVAATSTVGNVACFIACNPADPTMAAVLFTPSLAAFHVLITTNDGVSWANITLSPAGAGVVDSAGVNGQAPVGGLWFTTSGRIVGMYEWQDSGDSSVHVETFYSDTPATGASYTMQDIKHFAGSNNYLAQLVFSDDRFWVTATGDDGAGTTSVYQAWSMDGASWTPTTMSSFDTTDNYYEPAGTWYSTSRGELWQFFDPDNDGIHTDLHAVWKSTDLGATWVDQQSVFTALLGYTMPTVRLWGVSQQL